MTLKFPADYYALLAADTIDGDKGPGEREILLATRSFNMLPGDTARFAVAFAALADVIDYAGGADPRIESAAEKVIAPCRAGSTSYGVVVAR